jgi:hypothetical protein
VKYRIDSLQNLLNECTIAYIIYALTWSLFFARFQVPRVGHSDHIKLKGVNGLMATVI